MANEILNEEQLNQISGGDAAQTADDSRFLNSLNGSTDRYGDERILYGNHDGEIVRGWAKVGVQAIIHSGGFFNGGAPNKYFINGKQVTQEQARYHAMRVTGHYMNRNDWKW